MSGGRDYMRLGDPGSHGGQIVTASENTLVNGRGAARVGDIYACPIHGPNPIVTGSPNCLCNGRRIARLNDVTACGATLGPGSPDSKVN
jgi:uncharacterized Zn-binding protein involved in type VI secretion